MFWFRKYVPVVLLLLLWGCNITDDLSDCPPGTLPYQIDVRVRGLPAGSYSFSIHEPTDGLDYTDTTSTTGDPFSLSVIIPTLDFDNSPTIKFTDASSGAVLYPGPGMTDQLVDLIERSLPRDEIDATHRYTIEFDFSDDDNITIHINGWLVKFENHELVTLHMHIPPAQRASTRAITSTEECTISSLDVLVFRADSSSEIFSYAASATPAPGNVSGAEHQTFTVSVKAESYSQRLVLIANAASQVSTLLSSRDWTGTEKNTMLSNLRYSIPLSQTGWNTSSPSNFAPLPMWGESSPVRISPGSQTLGSTIDLLRMVARVDVRLDTSVSGLTSRFKLKSVGVYNTNSSGLIVPTPSNVSSEMRNGRLYTFVTAPSLPSGVTRFPPLTCTDFSSPGTPDIAMVGVIYILEALSNINPAFTPCLVIGGVYGSDSSTTFYRIDYEDPSGREVNILRNNHYTINITGVTGSGHATFEEAYNARITRTDNPAPIEYTLTGTP